MAKVKFTISQLELSGFVESNGTFVRENVNKNSKNVNKNSKSVTKFLTDDIFLRIIKQELKVDIVSEHRFDPDRKWRFDYAIPDHMIAIEVEGGVWTNGRHTRGLGYLKDMEKYNRAIQLGWRLIRVTPEDLVTADTMKMINEFLNK